ncbi:hypothetical protein FQA39_LY13529 [Lamprigera yunnana]|nr:hypothetical protein FQA39_LY13529 [Lamprigera yunnana]
MSVIFDNWNNSVQIKKLTTKVSTKFSLKMFSKTTILVVTILFFASTNGNEKCKSIDIAILLKDDSKRIFENAIAEIVECIREFMLNGIPEIGIVLDPFKLPFLPLFLNTQFIRSKMWLSGIFIGGLASFHLDKGSIDIKPFPPQAEVNVDLSFQKIKFTTNYDGKMNIFDFIRLYGKGTVNFDFDNFKFGLKAIINLISIKLDAISLQIQFPSVKAKVSGLFNDKYMSDIISRQMTSTFSQLAQEQQTYINDALNNYIEHLINGGRNSILEGVEFSNALEGNFKEFNCQPVLMKYIEFVNETFLDILNKNL